MTSRDWLASLLQTYLAISLHKQSSLMAAIQQSKPRSTGRTQARATRRVGARLKWCQGEFGRGLSARPLLPLTDSAACPVLIGAQVAGVGVVPQRRCQRTARRTTRNDLVRY